MSFCTAFVLVDKFNLLIAVEAILLCIILLTNDQNLFKITRKGKKTRSHSQISISSALGKVLEKYTLTLPVYYCQFDKQKKISNNL